MARITTMIFICLTLSFACNNDFLSEGNPSAASLGASFNTIEEAEQAVFATYAGFQANDFWAREFWWLVDMLSDETKTAGPQLEAQRFAMQQYNIDATSPLTAEVWKGLYRVIHRANLVITELPKKESLVLPAEDIEFLVSEAKFLRAYCYFQLLTYWGIVPFPTEPIVDIEGVPLAESEEVMYDLILSDLEAAEANLPDVTEYRGTQEIGRATKGSAQGLAARVLMFKGDLAGAGTHLENIISSGLYSLAPNYEDNHREENENNSESLWEIQFMVLEGDNWNGWAGNGEETKVQSIRGQEYSPFDWHNILPSDELKAAFEDGDPRYKLSFIEYGDSYGPPGDEDIFGPEDVAQGDIVETVHWRKYGNAYKKRTESLWSGINVREIRYADVLLMMAEVENELNGPNEQALMYLNMIRDRVGMPNYPTAEYPTSTKDEMFNAIVHERQVEFNSEQVRTRDVKRWFRDGKVPKPHPNYEEKHKYLPIPLSEIDNNPAVSTADQKPGY